jgi:hypothetical protein
MHEPEEMWRPPRNLRTWGRVLRICNRMNVLQKFAYNMSKGVLGKNYAVSFSKTGVYHPLELNTMIVKYVLALIPSSFTCGSLYL